MRAQISTMKELREPLAEMGNPINNEQFSAYIRTSLTPDYQPLLTSITVWLLLALLAKAYQSMT